MEFAQVYTAALDRAGITTKTYTHPPVATVEEAREHWSAIDATHTKNLLLKDEGRRFWLVVIPAEQPLDLKSLPASIGSRRLRFAPQEDLARLLGVQTGAVSPLALAYDQQGEVTLMVEEGLMGAPLLAFHPMRNDATVTLTPEELHRYVEAASHVLATFALP